MITVKSARDLDKMRVSGKIAAGALDIARKNVRAGITTFELDRLIHRYITEQGATPSFLGYAIEELGDKGFPNAACISVNQEVIHGIPSRKRVLKPGDIVSVDIGAFKDGFHGDTSATFAVGKISDEAKKLLKVTEDCLMSAISAARAGARVGDLSYAIESCCNAGGFTILKDFCGHGIGRELHEDPEIPNAGKAGKGVRLSKGMVIAIEPMVSVRGDEVYILRDGWTVVTKSGSLSAHFEHTVVVTDGDAVILTEP